MEVWIWWSHGSSKIQAQHRQSRHSFPLIGGFLSRFKFRILEILFWWHALLKLIRTKSSSQLAMSNLQVKSILEAPVLPCIALRCPAYCTIKKLSTRKNIKNETRGKYHHGKSKSKQKSKHVHVHDKREDQKNNCMCTTGIWTDFFPFAPFREMIYNF